MAKAFYLKLAWSNVKRNRLTYVPYLLATALISGVFMLIVGLINSPTLNNLPSGQTATDVFRFGIIVFAVFAVFFMLYINNFLVNRRKREFGLYGVLGLDKRHISRVLLWENFIVTAGGLVLGTIFALVFGYLLFLLLLKMLEFTDQSSFSIAPVAYGATYLLFGAVFVATSVLNSIRVRMVSAKSLMQSEKKGDKSSPLTIPIAILGAILLGIAYYLAWITEKPVEAAGLFFLLVLMVIVATFMLFSSGSIALLKFMRSRKKYYYKPKNFVTVAGMFHRMKQNARGLSFICILSTMLIVTVSGTLSLYLGKESIYRSMHPYDVQTALYLVDYFDEETGEYINSEDSVQVEEATNRYAELIWELAEEHNVVISSPVEKMSTDPEDRDSNNYAFDSITSIQGLIYANETFYFDVEGTQENCLAFANDLENVDLSQWHSVGRYVFDIFSTREYDRGAYGGLLFLGAFFGILFLAMAVLIIYFKQVTEGYEDQERFRILQQVGMDKKMVKGTINRQVLWVFFLPLVATLLHMVFASKIMLKMLELFQLKDVLLVLGCIGGVCVVFVLLYLLVYRLTARVYYKIVAFK